MYEQAIQQYMSQNPQMQQPPMQNQQQPQGNLPPQVLQMLMSLLQGNQGQQPRQIFPPQNQQQQQPMSQMPQGQTRALPRGW